MTTLIIDFKEQTVYSDSCVTNKKSMLHNKNLLGHLLTSSKTEDWHDFRVSRFCKDKIRSKGDVVILGTGDSDLINRFADYYGSEMPCEIGDVQETVIYVVGKRDKGLVVDKYSIKEVKPRWYLKRKNVWDIESFVQTSGYITAGSGKYFASGALEAGCTPHEAIKVASRLCPYTDSNVDSVKL